MCWCPGSRFEKSVVLELFMSAINRSIARGLITGALCLAALIGDAPTTAGAAGPGMRIAFPSGMNGPIVVAMDTAGILQQSGLKAEFDSFQYGPPLMEALSAGAIHAGCDRPAAGAGHT